MTDDTCNNLVLCEKQLVPGNFPVANLKTFETLPPLTQYWQRALKKAGFRTSLPFFENQISAHGAKLLHTHFGHIGAKTGTTLAKSTSIPQVVTFYGMDVDQIPASNPEYTRLYKSMFEHVSLVLCEGPHMAGKIARLGCQADKIRVHHLGIRLDQITYKKPQPPPRRPADSRAHRSVVQRKKRHSRRPKSDLPFN